MSTKASINRRNFERVLLGLPFNVWSPVAVHWQITGDLSKAGIETVEIHFFHTMLPELLSSESYLALFHSELLDLNDSANCDRATLIRLAILLPQSHFIIWDKLNLWTSSGVALPENLEVWSESQTDIVTNRLLDIYRKREMEQLGQGKKR